MAALRLVASAAFSIRSISMKSEVSQTGVVIVMAPGKSPCVCFFMVIICSMATSLSSKFDELTILEQGSCISSNRRQKRRKREASFCSTNALFRSAGSMWPNKFVGSLGAPFPVLFFFIINKKIILQLSE